MGRHTGNTIKTAKGIIARIQASKLARCADEKYCFGINWAVDSKRKWIAEHDLFTASDERIYTLVDTITRVYFMDAITGSLYEFGKCMTSQELKADSLWRDPGAAGRLMDMKAESGELT